MKIEELEHVIRAASVIAADDELIILGSQAILAAYPRAPDELLVSAEADMYPKNYPERADLIDGSIGELSPFHETFGYYAQGVAPGTALLPDGWMDRLIAITGPGTRGATGWCLHPHDLALSKLAAGRDKDLRFVRDMAKHRMLDAAALEAMAQSLAVALAPLGIAVATVAPGFVETDVSNAHLKTPRGPEIRAQSPFNRVARPDEVAAAIVWLSSPEAEWASGAILDLNGASYLRT